MTEHERDQRDLAMLAAYEGGATKAVLMRTYGVTKHYLNKLLKEVCDDFPN